MRNLIFGINLSLDGVVDHTKMMPDEEVHEYFTHIMEDSDLLLYGRKTYELMVPFWPDMAKNHEGQSQATTEFAQTFDSISRLVFSRTLTSVDDEKTRLTSADLETEIRNLKQQEGRNIIVGGVDLPTQLIKLNLVDEFCFVVHPVLVGEGRRFLDIAQLQENMQLKLVASKVFRSGAVGLHYVRK